MLALELQPEFEAMGVGSTGQTELGRAAIAEVKVVVPPDIMRQRFSQCVGSLRHLGVRLQNASERLEEMRDLLLPKLVTGQIDVSKLDLDAVLEGAAG